MKKLFFVALGLALASAWLLLKGTSIDSAALGVGLGLGSYCVAVVWVMVWAKNRSSTNRRAT